MDDKVFVFGIKSEINRTLTKSQNKVIIVPIIHVLKLLDLVHASLSYWKFFPFKKMLRTVFIKKVENIVSVLLFFFLDFFSFCPNDFAYYWKLPYDSTL